MSRLFAVATNVTLFAFGALSFGQGGGMGGGFAGAQQGNQGPYQGDGSAQSISQEISTYLNGEEIKSVLTPGEFVEWTLKLKAGQVVVAEARSDAFDPGLQVLDDKNKVLADNDDRYPGDQRPLLFWRCEKDGDYLLHVKSFRDKSGGQVFTRFKVYDTVDVPSDRNVEKDVPPEDVRGPNSSTQPELLLRIPMRAGQIKEILSDDDVQHRVLIVHFGRVIAPNGLPEEAPRLADRLNRAVRALVAPVAGDYYVMASVYSPQDGGGKIHVWTREIVPEKLAKESDSYSARGQNNTYAIWEISVKKGDFLRAATPELDYRCQLVAADEPDFTKYDMSKPETNPFYPHGADQAEPAIDVLSAREGDARITVFRARRDAKLWLSSNCAGPAGKQFTLTVGPGASEYAAGKSNSGKLRIADTDYWAFDANAGDVMALSATATAFKQISILRDPDLAELRHFEAELDQSTDDWRLIVQKPGRYLLAFACFGNGGSGEYSLTRKVYHPQDFGLATPAKGDIANGQVQVWKFVATPNDPLLIHWTSSNWSYEISIYNEKGERSDFERQRIDDHNAYGILKVDEPRTFVIVLTGHGDKANYSIALDHIPGYKPAVKQ